MDENRVTLEWLILADSAEIVGGKLYMLGGGWKIFYVPEFPAQARFKLALAFQVPWTMTNQHHDFELELVDQDGQRLIGLNATFEVGRPVGLPAGHTQRFPAVLGMGGTFPKAGTYVIIVRGADGEYGRTSFDLIRNPVTPPVLPGRR
ncbi:MAG TPA: hypothetical protein VGE45_00810 [Chloroflexia bacterium]|jgi:hypothetical protein